MLTILVIFLNMRVAFATFFMPAPIISIILYSNSFQQHTFEYLCEYSTVQSNITHLNYQNICCRKDKRKINQSMCLYKTYEYFMNRYTTHILCAHRIHETGKFDFFFSSLFVEHEINGLIIFILAVEKKNRSIF